MRELVPLTNAVAARMIVSRMWAFGGNHVIVAGVRASVPTAADAATEATAVNTQAVPAANSAAEGKAALPVIDRSRELHSARWLLAAV